MRAVPGRSLLVAVACIVVLAGCTGNSSAPPVRTPTPGSVAAGLHCQGDDHGLNVAQLGWGFCYPASWKFRERDVSTTLPAGVDTTLDIVGDQGLFGPPA